MATLKDTIITGDLRVTGTIYGLNATNINGVLPIANGGTGASTATQA
jgi:hypothetical protein